MKLLDMYTVSISTPKQLMREVVVSPILMIRTLGLPAVKLFPQN